jgi:hypothetical protein
VNTAVLAGRWAGRLIVVGYMLVRHPITSARLAGEVIAAYRADDR